jgi:membrane-associated protease RseP (regulator of RpoE activity)
MVFIPRVAPIVGLDLEAGDEAGSVVVKQVRGDGPAAASGITAGDRIVSIDGIVVRSVYSVRTPIMQKRPGDKVTFGVEQKSALKNIEITLGGGVELTDQQLVEAKIASLVNPRIEIKRGQQGFDVIQPGSRNLSIDGDLAKPAAGKPDETQIVEKALDRYLGLIVRLRDQLGERTAERDKLQKELDAMKAELEAIKKK